MKIDIEKFILKLREELPFHKIWYRKDIKWNTILIETKGDIYGELFIVTERQLRNEKIAKKRLQDIVKYIIKNKK